MKESAAPPEMEPAALQPVEILRQIEALEERQDAAVEIDPPALEGERPSVVEPAATEPAPVAMPRMGDDDAFIPPAPRSGEHDDGEAKPDPFAAAAMTNGAREAEKPAPAAEAERPSLFERVTRTGRAALGRIPSDSRPVAQPQTPIIPRTIETERKTDVPAMPAASAAVADSVAVMAVKPVFGAVAEATMPKPEQAEMAELAPASTETEDEDDLLDIPAFLRRQAN